MSNENFYYNLGKVWVLAIFLLYGWQINVWLATKIGWYKPGFTTEQVFNKTKMLNATLLQHRKKIFEISQSQLKYADKFQLDQQEYFSLFEKDQLEIQGQMQLLVNELKIAFENIKENKYE